MITIFGQQSCGYCREAKALCERNNLEYKYIDIVQENVSFSDMEEMLGKKIRTVPQIFNGQEYIGGYTELKARIDARNEKTN